MKNLKFILMVFVGILAIIFIPSCIHEETLQLNSHRNKLNPRIPWYHAEWDEWGRASRDCASWGLCNFTDCWFCLTNPAGSGEISFNDTTGIGTLTIELDPTIAVQAQAISNQIVLFIDSDISNETTEIEEFDYITLKAGEYLFQSNIGAYGGYVVDLICD